MSSDKISLQISLSLLVHLWKMVLGFLSSWWLWLPNRRIRLEESEAFRGSAALNTQALFSYHCIAPSPLLNFCKLLSLFMSPSKTFTGEMPPLQSWPLDKGDNSP